MNAPEACDLFLIRHGSTDMLGRKLAGRMPGIHLNEKGKMEAEGLASRLSGVPFMAIYCSPLERAMETAAPLSASTGLVPVEREGLNEIRFGEWTGRDFDELSEDPLWKRFNTFRSGTRIPGGELIAEVQARVVSELEHIGNVHPGAAVAVFTHGDVVKAAVAYYAGISLDHIFRIEISPASVSVIAIGDWGPRILKLNDTGRTSITAEKERG